MTEELSKFIDLSAALTGFGRIDLLSTGVGADYLELLRGSLDEGQLGELLDAWATVSASTDITKSIKDEIWDREQLGQIARNLVQLWYLGSWFAQPEFGVVSVAAYQEGMIWKALGARARGSKPPGFGAWSNPPS